MGEAVQWKVRCAHTKLVSIRELKPHPRNPNDHTQDQIEQLAKIIEYQGWRDAIRVSLLSGCITAGHGRLLTAKYGKQELVPVDFQEYENEDQEYADVVSDNAIALWAELNRAKINQEIQSLAPTFKLDLLGIKGFVLDVAERLSDEDEDSIPGKRPECFVRRGDIFSLGRHRVMCGDATSLSDVDNLMRGEKAKLVFTDPPYNVAGNTQMETLSKIRPNSYGKLKDSAWDQAFDPNDVFPMLLACLCKDASIYVCASHFLAGKIWEWMSTWADYYGGCVWVKSNPMPSMHKRHWTWDYEHICYATRGKHIFNFPRDGHAKATWEIAKNPRNDLHPTQKPVSVPEHAIRHSSHPGDLVLDLFAGSGTTLIAADKANRRAFLMELDPEYAQVILDRFARYNKTDPIRDDGAKWSELRA